MSETPMGSLFPRESVRQSVSLISRRQNSPLLEEHHRIFQGTKANRNANLVLFVCGPTGALKASGAQRQVPDRTPNVICHSESRTVENLHVPRIFLPMARTVQRVGCCAKDEKTARIQPISVPVRLTDGAQFLSQLNCLADFFVS
jgi:hypothetical protein